jgi:hypothetical protein
VAATATASPSREDITRVEKWTREPFSDYEDSLRPGTATRRAFDAALREIQAGRREPSIEWRRRYSLLLGLERLLATDEPKLADGAVLSAHQVDALSGTLTALIAEEERQNGHQAEAAAEAVERTLGVSGDGPADVDEEELEDGDKELDEDLEVEDESDDWLGDELERGAAENGDEQFPEQPEDPSAARRFWFEHATGAGKTVAALGFVDASRTGGVLILTHRRNLVDQFLGELRDRGYGKRIYDPLLASEDSADGPVTVETYQWFVRNAGNVSDAYTIVICDEAHRPRGEASSRHFAACAFHPARTCARWRRFRCARARSTRTSTWRSSPRCWTRGRSTRRSPTCTGFASSTSPASSTRRGCATPTTWPKPFAPPA